MKWMNRLVLTMSVVAFAVAGCGGGSSGGGTTTPAATSAKTITALTNAANWMYTTALAVPGALPTGGGASLKAAAPEINCTGTATGYECVIWDESGSATSADHKCNVSGDWDSATMTFDLAYDCYTFKPDADVTVDGNWTATVVINTANMPTASVKDVGGALAKADATATCDVDDVADTCGQTFSGGGATCSVDCEGAATCTSAAAVFSIQWTAGTRGVTITDPCGTYTIASGTTSGNDMCMPTNSSFDASFSINGTINGTAIDQEMNVGCDFEDAL